MKNDITIALTGLVVLGVLLGLIYLIPLIVYKIVLGIIVIIGVVNATSDLLSEAKK